MTAYLLTAKPGGNNKKQTINRITINDSKKQTIRLIVDRLFIDQRQPNRIDNGERYYKLQIPHFSCSSDLMFTAVIPGAICRRTPEA